MSNTKAAFTLEMALCKIVQTTDWHDVASIEYERGRIADLGNASEIVRMIENGAYFQEFSKIYGEEIIAKAADLIAAEIDQYSTGVQVLCDEDFIGNPEEAIMEISEAIADVLSVLKRA